MMRNNTHRIGFHLSYKWYWLFNITLLISVVFLPVVFAQDHNDPIPAATPPPEPQGSPLHPAIMLLDTNGTSVLESGEAISTINTCGTCHDSEFITSHSFHADVGLSSYSESDTFPAGQVWDTSPGLFGKWNPITYRYLSPRGAEAVDVTTADWLRTTGLRHVGGGPAVVSRDGIPLTELPSSPLTVENSVVDPDTGELVPWDWNESGVVEMNCFLCHVPEPNNEVRASTLQAGQFAWANTATLVGTGIVEQSGDSFVWNEEAFAEDGTISREVIQIQDPNNKNCGQCHGLVHVDAQTPLVLEECEASQWSTITTGQIFSPQRISNSGINFVHKDFIGRAYDVHAERVIDCVDCHYSLNNPVFYQEGESQPDHLVFDPRRIDFGDYLYRPLHQFASGQSSSSTLASEFDNSLRRCESCHSIEVTHDWLPYKESHTEALACESCHVPQMYAPSRQYIDWTVLQSTGRPVAQCRGIVEEGETFGSGLFEGFQPVLLPRENADGSVALAPHNLVSSWFWVHGDPSEPVPMHDLQAIYIDGDDYTAEVYAAFDADNNGVLSDEELLLDTAEKLNLITNALVERGLDNPRIESVVIPYSINHDVAHGEWATRDCDTCHSDDSRINAALIMSDRTPGGVIPTFVSNPLTLQSGEIVLTEDNILFFQPNSSSPQVNLYILGHDTLYWVDWLGTIIFLGTLLGVVAHGGLRYFAARRRASQAEHADQALHEVYMYTVYERLWHWLQTAVIFGLIFTGIAIHRPNDFSAFSFRYMVLIHNVLAAILVINAALAAFYHLASGEIKQFLPEPRGFFGSAFKQAMYYLRGIFRGEEHPFEKTPEHKMNPLQQVTYLGLLNVLLPLQIITGGLMWGEQQFPRIADSLGGLPLLAPFHTLLAWLFATFIIMHVYLTTTGHTPLAGIKGMMLGYDEVEVHGGESATTGASTGTPAPSPGTD